MKIASEMIQVDYYDVQNMQQDLVLRYQKTLYIKHKQSSINGHGNTLKISMVLNSHQV